MHSTAELKALLLGAQRLGVQGGYVPPKSVQVTPEKKQAW